MMKRKFRVFTEVHVVIEKEVEATSVDEARRKGIELGYSDEDVMNGEWADDKVTGVEDSATGKLTYFD